MRGKAATKGGKGLQHHTEHCIALCTQGVLASATDLEEVFGTTNQEEICREILDRGELQISDKERQAELTK